MGDSHPDSIPAGPETHPDSFEPGLGGPGTDARTDIERGGFQPVEDTPAGEGGETASAPSADSPGTPGGTAGTGGENRVQEGTEMER